MQDPSYIPLSSSPTSDETDYDDHIRLNPYTSSPIPSNAFLRWTSIITLISSIISCVLLSAITLKFLRSPSSPPIAIRRASTYMNLDKVPKTTSLPSITTFAHVVMQVNINDPKRRMYEDDRGFFSSEGGIYPNDRHVVIRPETSTIVQFRHVDFGLETCVLHFLVPNKTMEHRPETLLTTSSIVDVFTLDTTTEMSNYIAGSSLDYAPSRRKAFTRFTIAQEGDSLESPLFHCPSGKFSTFEFCCAGGGCSVDFWQTKNAPLNGIYMVQHDTDAVVTTHVNVTA